ncbi:MAG: hypothetical protein NVS3B21_09530 [Acidimicrobiales bacterium]
MSHSPHSSPFPPAGRQRAWGPRHRTLLALAGVACISLGIVPLSTDRPAGATVDHRLGYVATVQGWSSWYGSYGMDGLGATWCIDHGIPAPDPSYGYRPTTVSDHTRDTTTAMAWMLGRYGPEAARVTAAAITLVLHDLAGATYPGGRLDVGHLDGHVAGFGGDETGVVARAIALRADAVAHSRLEGPFSMTVRTAAAGAIVRIVDRRGQPVAGAAVATTLGRASTRTGTSPVITDTDGQARLAVGRTGQDVSVEATIPDLTLAAFAPQRAVAQRVAVGRRTVLHLALETTPTTTAPPTTAPPTTAPPTTAPPTTAPPTTALPATTAPPTTALLTTATPALPVVAVVSSPATPQLPFTGTALRSTVWCGLGLVLIGLALVLGTRVPAN